MCKDSDTLSVLTGTTATTEETRRKTGEPPSCPTPQQQGSVPSEMSQDAEESKWQREAEGKLELEPPWENWGSSERRAD